MIIKSTQNVLHTRFKRLRSTPLLINISTVSTSLFWQARCKGVLPFCNK